MKSDDSSPKPTLDRRSFLTSVAAGTGIALASGTPTFAFPHDDDFDADHANMHATVPDSPEYWAGIKKMFALKPGRTPINAANLCPSWRPVTQTLIDGTRDIDGDVSFQNRGKYDAIKEDTRDMMATLLGADPDEIGLIRNTSEGNATVISGLNLAKAMR